MNTLLLSRDLFPLIGRILYRIRRIQNMLLEDYGVRNSKIFSFTYCHLFFLLKQGTKFLIND